MQHLVHNTIQYNVALPKGFDPSEKYPLVIYVHGAADGLFPNNGLFTNRLLIFHRKCGIISHIVFQWRILKQ